MAERIDYRGVKMPPPTKALFNAMAECAFNELSEVIPTLNGLTGQRVHIEWEDTPLVFQETMESMAKTMYCMIAKQGGARVVELKGGV